LISDQFTNLQINHIALALQSMNTYQLAECKYQASIQNLIEMYPNAPLHVVNLVDTPLEESIFMEYYHLLGAIIRYHPEETFKCIASFMNCLRYLMFQVAKQTEQYPHKTGTSNKLSVRCATHLARLFSEMASHNSKARHFVVYLLSDYITLLRKQALDEQTKSTLLPGIYDLLDTCSEFELKQLFATLGEAGKTLFKSLYADYTRDHKFRGKV